MVWKMATILENRLQLALDATFHGRCLFYVQESVLHVFLTYLKSLAYLRGYTLDLAASSEVRALCCHRTWGGEDGPTRSK